MPRELLALGMADKLELLTDAQQHELATERNRERDAADPDWRQKANLQDLDPTEMRVFLSRFAPDPAPPVAPRLAAHGLEPLTLSAELRAWCESRAAPA